MWAQDQVVRGTVEGAGAGTLYVNGTPVAFDATAGTFAVPLRLTAPTTTVVACASGAGGEVCGDTLRWTLGYQPRPEAELRATVQGRGVQFAGHVLDHPAGGTLTFTWAEGPANPAPLDLAVTGDSTASATVPPDAPPGEYTVAWTVRAADGGERTARTFVTVGPDGAVTPFDLANDHAAWVDRATLYEVTPRHFPGAYRGSFDAVRQKLPELVVLGVNTLWLQPVYPTTDEDQGYPITDYFGVRSDLGTEASLRALIEEAHGHGLRVLFDFVPNHTSTLHAYARNAIAHGARSHYYDFYQRTTAPAPYSQHYVTRQVGAMTFVTYFGWNDEHPMANLNYDNPEVQRMIIEASRYWIETFDIDGYRFDVAWGVQARNPAFVQEWRRTMKRVKPEVLLLAEAKATDEALFDGAFDAAYDWTVNTSCISQAVWQLGCESTTTVFNSGVESSRAVRLRNALTDLGRGYHPDAVILRYLENNDTARFRGYHTPAQTRMAAALMFSLHGIPMLYYGQEAGYQGGQYEYPPYVPSRTIASYDTEGLFPFYQHLLRLRAAFPALYSDHFAEVGVTAPPETPGRTFAYRRWEGAHHVVGVVNLSDDPMTVTLALPVSEMGLDPATTYYLTDLVSGEAQSGTGAELAAAMVVAPPFTLRLFAVADSVVAVPTAGEDPAGDAPLALALEPNHPNPFSGATTLTYRVAQPGAVRLVVFDVLGREVARPVDGVVPAGRHTVAFDGSSLAGGVYVCRLETGGRAVTRRMVLAR